MRRVTMLLMFALATTGALVAACGGGNGESGEGDDRDLISFDRPEPPAEIKDLEKPEFTEELETTGKELFDVHCRTCHGPEGKGDAPAGMALNPPAQDLTNPELQAALTDRYIYWRIMEGGAVLGYVGMTPFKAVISDVEDRWALVAFVRTLDDSVE